MSDRSETQPLTLVDQAPKWQSSDHTHEMAKSRSKRNTLFTDATGQYEPMFNKSAAQKEDFDKKKTDTIPAIEREFHFLQLLQDTGVTPTPLQLTYSADRTEVHMATSVVNGVSLEAGRQQELNKDHFSTIVDQVDQAVTTIHQHGAVIVDVNTGTFVIEGLVDQKPVKVSVVDLEMAEELAELNDPQKSEEVVHRIKSRCVPEDPGAYMANYGPNFRITAENAQQIERYLALRTVLDCYLQVQKKGFIPTDLSRLSDTDRAAYDTQLSAISPMLDVLLKEVDEGRTELFQSWAMIGAEPEEGLEWFLDQGRQSYTERVMLNITLPYQLEDAGLTVEPQTLDRMRRQLSPILPERPVN